MQTSKTGLNVQVKMMEMQLYNFITAYAKAMETILEMEHE